MNITTRASCIGTVFLLLILTACGGSGGGDTSPTAISAAGGTVAGRSGAQVVVPAGALAQNTAIEIAQTSAVVPLTIFVNADGSFFPDVMSIQEGDTVQFMAPPTFAPGLGLGTTFSLARTKLSELNANVSCMTTTKSYDITHDDPELDNEITGPLHRGSSGIFALGPEGPTASFEGSTADTCDAIASAAGIAPILPDKEQWEFEDGRVSRLCRKVEIRSGKSAATNSPYVLASTWDDPAIAGVIVRINWKSLYATVISTDGATETIVPDYTVLDTELDNASRRGKQIFLEVLAGSGIPPWIFDDYVPRCSGHGCVPPSTTVATETGIAPTSVIPVVTSDFGTPGGGSSTLPNVDNCGYQKTMGSPADPAYRLAMLTMIGKLADHIRSSSLRYQALGSFKITGLNFLTGETRLPNRCLDPAQNLPNQLNCFCNTKIWASTLGKLVRAFVPAEKSFPPPSVKGGGYTTEKAQKFLYAVENAIFVAFGRRKTMHYMLIQDGLPQVLDASHYDTEAPPDLVDNFGYVDAAGARIKGTQQTEDILANGRLGLFHGIDAAGNPLSLDSDPSGVLFSPMHAGLKWMPTDGVACSQQQSTTPNTDGKDEANLRLPFTYSTVLSPANYGGGTCPNKWAVREGYEGQVMGFQTSNDVATLDQLSSALWNGTLNSNMVFLEAYEHALWLARQGALGSDTVLNESADASRQKSLAAWSAELHNRRRTMASWTIAAKNSNLREPYPDPYTFKFRKDLALGEVQTIYFVNPAARCQSGTTFYGTINVTGNNIVGPF